MTAPDISTITGTAITKAWEIFNKEFRSLLHIIVLLHLPLSVIAGFFPELGKHTSMGLAGILYSITVFILSIISNIAVVHLASQHLGGKKVTAEAALHKGLRIFFPVLTTLLMVTAATAVLLIFLIIPGIIFIVFTAFCMQVMVTQNKFFSQAIRGSIEFVSNRWWYVFGCLLLLVLAFLLVMMLVGIPFGLIPKNTFVNIMELMMTAIFGSFFTVAITVLFFELKKTQAPPTSASNLL